MRTGGPMSGTRWAASRRAAASGGVQGRARLGRVTRAEGLDRVVVSAQPAAGSRKPVTEAGHLPPGPAHDGGRALRLPVRECFQAAPQPAHVQRVDGKRPVAAAGQPRA